MKSKTKKFFDPWRGLNHQKWKREISKFEVCTKTQYGALIHIETISAMSFREMNNDKTVNHPLIVHRRAIHRATFSCHETGNNFFWER